MNNNADKKRHPATVAYFSPAWPKRYVANGIVTYVANLYEGMKKMGVNPYILSNKTKFGFWPEGIIALNRIKFYFMPAEEIAANVRKLKKEKNIEIFEMEETFGWARGVAQNIPVPLIVRLHGPWFLNGRANGVLENERFKKRMKNELLGMQNANGLTAPSRDVLKQTQAYYGAEFRNSRVIPYPVEIISEEKRWKLDSCDKKKILFVGRFDKHKGADILIEAFALIIKKIPAMELIFVGPNRGLEKDEKHWGITEYINRVMPKKHRRSVRWLGQLSAERILELRKEAFLTVIPSRYETLGYAVLESMSYGCPTIASNVGGILEVVENNRNGLLFETENPDDLANKMLSLIQDEALAKRLAQQAAKDIEAKYHPQKIACETLDYYAEILNQK